MGEARMNENEFELDGKVYVAVEGKDCDGCAFCDGPDDNTAIGCGLSPRCYPHGRIDNRSVIFTEKTQ